jgi:predicted nuclease of predicted toxin-antitoxin system
MRFLADENFPGHAVRLLRENHFDVSWVSEAGPGAADEVVLETSRRQMLTLLTLDRDFGELVFHRGLPAECGVILFRLETNSPEMFAAFVLEILSSRSDWSGFFTVATNDRIRMRPIPPRFLQ